MGGVGCDADGYGDGAEVLSAVLDSKVGHVRSELFGAADGVVKGCFAKKDAELFSAVAARDVFFAEVFS